MKFMATCKKCGLTDLSSIIQELCGKGRIESIPKAELSCFNQERILFHTISYCHLLHIFHLLKQMWKNPHRQWPPPLCSPDTAPEQLHPEK